MWKTAVALALLPSMAFGQNALFSVRLAETTNTPSPPTIAAASQCKPDEWTVYLRGGLLGSMYDVKSDNGNLAGTFPVSPNAEGMTVQLLNATGAFSKLRARSSHSGGFTVFGPPFFVRTTGAPLLAPTLAPENWECGQATWSEGHLPGDVVRLLAVPPGGGAPATRFVVPSAFGTKDYLPSGATRFVAGEALFSNTRGVTAAAPRPIVCNHTSRTGRRLAVLQFSHLSRLNEPPCFPARTPYSSTRL